MKEWEKVKYNGRIVPPQCTYNDCFVEARWFENWAGNFYCQEHREVIDNIMKGEQ